MVEHKSPHSLNLNISKLLNFNELRELIPLFQIINQT